MREVIKACGDFGVKYLTLYAFSVENWNRPKSEINTLMNLLEKFLRDELARANELYRMFLPVAADATVKEMLEHFK